MSIFASSALCGAEDLSRGRPAVFGLSHQSNGFFVMMESRTQDFFKNNPVLIHIKLELQSDCAKTICACKNYVDMKLIKKLSQKMYFDHIMINLLYCQLSSLCMQLCSRCTKKHTKNIVFREGHIRDGIGLSQWHIIIFIF
jgi:hypothetical protein